MDALSEAENLVLRLWIAGWEWTTDYDEAHRDAMKWLIKRGLLPAELV